MALPLARPPAQSLSPGEPRVFSVGALLRLVRRELEAEHGDLWVEGEVADLARPGSGHVYFALKDEGGGGTLRAVMWRNDAARLRFRLTEGARVRARGNLTLYEARGTFQMRVVHLEEAGRGDLGLRFEEVRARLEAEGLLDEGRKRSLPRWPRHVGIVTSRDGAALRDVLKVLAGAVPVRLTLCHAAVQGETAAAEVEAALDRLAAMAERGGPEVVIVARGGGSADELWAFNEERVARAIARCPVPVVSGVGHQVDVTIADLVADRRAATPTEAAALTVPSRDEATRRLSDLSGRLGRAGRVGLRERRAELAEVARRLPEGPRLLDPARQRVDDLLRAAEAAARAAVARRLRRRSELDGRLARLAPAARVARRRALLVGLSARLESAGNSGLSERRARLGRAGASLDALSPLAVLGRGYALARRPGGDLVTDAAEVSAGDTVEVSLRRGRLECVVRATSVEEEPNAGSRPRGS